MSVRRRYTIAFGLAALLAVGAGRVVLTDGIIDALCALYGPGSFEWVLLGCESHNDPHGS